METKLKHRKASIELHLQKQDGIPAANQEVKISQKNHQFLFGVGGFEAVELAGGKPGTSSTPPGQPLDPEREKHLQEKLGRLYTLSKGGTGFNNFATLPFYIGRYEPVEGKPDETRTKAGANWFKDRGIKLKGHPLCWHTVCADWLMNYDNATILKKVIERIERDVSTYAGLIDMWDVINEVVIMPIFDKYDNAITRICKEYGQIPLVKQVFEAAKRANPNAILLLNDFDMSKDYEILIEKCLDAGIPIDVIGLQSHQHQGYWGAEKVNNILERFSRFGLPLHFTENTIISGDIMPPHIVDLNDWQVEEWPTTPEGEERQAKELTEMYEILFEHPKVEAITTWSGGDDAWLHAPAGFLRVDNSEKPSHTVLKDKIYKEWATNLTAKTDANGIVKLEGYKGDYEILLENNSGYFKLDGKDNKAVIRV
ncbi:MAG: endo-1,4-beta-xylanase [Treponema sp.]|jgi:GH35 family endo-1,4-beta-xylanase|nr:endo-1,4-beta-xylanase [Treponema sp.]